MKRVKKADLLKLLENLYYSPDVMELLKPSEKSKMQSGMSKEKIKFYVDSILAVVEDYNSYYGCNEPELAIRRFISDVEEFTFENLKVIQFGYDSEKNLAWVYFSIAYEVIE